MHAQDNPQNSPRQDSLGDTLFIRFNQLQLYTGLCLLLGLLIFMLARTIMLFHFGDISQLSSQGSELLHAYKLGFLFDIQVLVYCFVLFVVLGSLVLAKKSIFTAYQRIYHFIAIIILDVCLLVAIVNFYFYQYFNSRINDIILDLNNGRADAVMVSVWNHYPLVKIAITLLLASYIFHRILKFAQSIIVKVYWKPGKLLGILFVIFSIFLYFLAIRGSVDKTFPLREAAATFSNSHLINQSVINGLGSLVRVYEHKNRFSKPVKVSKQEGVVDFNRFFQKKLTEKNFSLANLYTVTPKNDKLVANPPSVVFIQMEGMSRHFLLFANQHNNMLGRLGKHTKHDLFFTHFLSTSQGTDSALEYFILNSPNSYAFQSYHCPAPLPSSVAKPFKKAGYETVFLTSDHLGFINAGEFLRTQAFDKVYGKNAILKKFPRAEKETWGVYDHHAFDFAYYLIEKAHKAHRPIFIYINTVSNHPPYSIPNSYKPYPVKVPPGLAKRMQVSDTEARAMFRTYQYVANALGEFMTRVENSPFADKTIVGASGDHNQHELMFHYPDYRERALQFSVPFYLHIPKAYQPTTPVDQNRLASHKDIFPTLYNLALSEARYLNLGDNLLAKEPSQFLFAYNTSAILIPSGLIYLVDKTKFHPWADKNKIYVGEGRELNKEQKQILARIKSYRNLLYWQLNRGVMAVNCS